MATANVTAQQTAPENLDFSSSQGSVPEKILIFSGKRKSGKDFITDALFQRLGDETSVIIKLSGPIKNHWAETKKLDASQLFSDGKYKEKYRLEMTKWGEEKRNEDYGYFCRAAIHMYNASNKKIWIISDARRKTDLKWFGEHFGDKCKTIRISSTGKTRKIRGWVFCKGIDDSETECDLDDVINWDLEVNNDDEAIDSILQQILDL